MQKNYGDNDPLLSYTVSSGSIVEGDSFTGGLYREKAGTATEKVGVYDIKSNMSNANYVISYIPSKLEIVRAPLVITATTPQGKDIALEYGSALPSISYTVSGLRFNDTINEPTNSSNLGNVTVVCNASDVSAPGNYPITVGGLGNVLDSYTVSYTNSNVQIIPRTILAKANGYSKSYGDEDKPLSCNISAPNAVNKEKIDTSDNGSALYPFTYTLSRIQGEGLGKYAISINTDANVGTYYNIKYNKADVEIVAALLLVTAKDSSREYGDANPEFSVKYEGFKNGESESVLNGKLTVTTTAIRESSVGQYAIIPSGLSSDNYDVRFAHGSLNIEKRNVYAHMQPAEKVYGEPDAQMTYTLPQAVIDPINSPLIGTPVRIQGENVGKYKIMANFPNPNYKVFVVSADFTIKPAQLIARVKDATKIYGNANPAFELEYSGFKHGDTTNAILGKPVFATLANEKSQAGNYPVIATGGVAADNYNISFEAGNLAITQRPITVIIDNKVHSLGGAEQALTYTLSEQLVDTSSPLKVALQREQGNSVGEYIISGTAENSNYIITIQNGIYEITAAPTPTPEPPAAFTPPTKANPKTGIPPTTRQGYPFTMPPVALIVANIAAYLHLNRKKEKE